MIMLVWLKPSLEFDDEFESKLTVVAIVGAEVVGVLEVCTVGIIVGLTVGITVGVTDAVFVLHSVVYTIPT